MNCICRIFQIPYFSNVEKVVEKTEAQALDSSSLITCNITSRVHKIMDNGWGFIKLNVQDRIKEFKDAILFSADGDAVAWDWNWDNADKMRHVPGTRIKDIEHFLGNRKIEMLILSLGRGHGGGLENPGPGILEVEPGTAEHFRKQGIEVVMLKTAAAIDLYKRSCMTKKIAAFVHTTC